MDTYECEVVPPCRVLMRNGVPVNEVVVDRPRVAEDLNRTYIEPAKPTRYVPQVRAVGRPRTHPVKAKPHAGQGYAWNKMGGVTVERVLELQADGLTAEQIGARLECSQATVFARLRKNRREHPEIAGRETEARTCACGEKKWPGRESCSYCRARARKRKHCKTATDNVFLCQP